MRRGLRRRRREVEGAKQEIWRAQRVDESLGGAADCEGGYMVGDANQQTIGADKAAGRKREGNKGRKRGEQAAAAKREGRIETERAANTGHEAGQWRATHTQQQPAQSKARREARPDAAAQLRRQEDAAGEAFSAARAAKKASAAAAFPDGARSEWLLQRARDARPRSLAPRLPRCWRATTGALASRGAFRAARTCAGSRLTCDALSAAAAAATRSMSDATRQVRRGGARARATYRAQRPSPAARRRCGRAQGDCGGARDHVLVGPRGAARLPAAGGRLHAAAGVRHAAHALAHAARAAAAVRAAAVRAAGGAGARHVPAHAPDAAGVRAAVGRASPGSAAPGRGAARAGGRRAAAADLHRVQRREERARAPLLRVSALRASLRPPLRVACDLYRPAEWQVFCAVPVLLVCGHVHDCLSARAIHPECAAAHAFHHRSVRGVRVPGLPIGLPRHVRRRLPPVLLESLAHIAQPHRVGAFAHVRAQARRVLQRASDAKPATLARLEPFVMARPHRTIAMPPREDKKLSSLLLPS
ncbi:hypothetical protein FGB62_22g849 [Gracilaria domingensis]|nr:hypothetical protein FGB62_22g849 [Gracilaria domingensis]